MVWPLAGRQYQQVAVHVLQHPGRPPIPDFPDTIRRCGYMWLPGQHRRRALQPVDANVRFHAVLPQPQRQNWALTRAIPLGQRCKCFAYRYQCSLLPAAVLGMCQSTQLPFNLPEPSLYSTHYLLTHQASVPRQFALCSMSSPTSLNFSPSIGNTLLVGTFWSRLS